MPGRSTTSATIAARSLGSTARPARSAGATIARSSSSGDIGVIASVRAARRSPKPRTERGASKKSARRVATIADPARRLQRGGPDGLEQPCPLVLIGDQREDLLELVEDDQELGIGIREDAIGRPDESERVALQILEQRRRRFDGDAEEGGLELAEGMAPREARRSRTSVRSRRSLLAAGPGSGPRERPMTSPSPTARRRRGTATPPRPASRRRRSRFVTASRPKKSPASASRNARSPLYGFRISRGPSLGAAEPSSTARNAAASFDRVAEPFADDLRGRLSR